MKSRKLCSIFFHTCRLLQHLDLFLNSCSLEQVKLGLPIGELLQEIFQGGPSITLIVKDQHIAKMMSLSLLIASDNCDQHAILQALIDLMVVSC